MDLKTADNKDFVKCFVWSSRLAIAAMRTLAEAKDYIFVDEQEVTKILFRYYSYSRYNDGFVLTNAINQRDFVSRIRIPGFVRSLIWLLDVCLFRQYKQFIIQSFAARGSMILIFRSFVDCFVNCITRLYVPVCLSFFLMYVLFISGSIFRRRGLCLMD